MLIHAGFKNFHSCSVLLPTLAQTIIKYLSILIQGRTQGGFMGLNPFPKISRKC